MQRQRGDLVPIGEVVADLDGPVQAIRDASPQKGRGSGWLVRGDAAASVLDAAEFAQRQKVARRCLGRLRQWNLNPGPLALLPWPA